ncbi:uncharacterized protein LOC129730648 [Wyeomyia smithii]|uniref:uncharacterized protein LOC129730648 n=1 Tax=Wyeomyia smithii TaxID=174621 RepID=UPI002467E7A5|nr:uncharacterized protein LOC129730648 [Wyeomyia smithii]
MNYYLNSSTSSEESNRKEKAILNPAPEQRKEYSEQILQQNDDNDIGTREVNLNSRDNEDIGRDSIAPLKYRLAWFVSDYRLSVAATRALLKILRDKGFDVPMSRMTRLETPNTVLLPVFISQMKFASLVTTSLL